MDAAKKTPCADYHSGFIKTAPCRIGRNKRRRHPNPPPSFAARHSRYANNFNHRTLS